jgi:Uma2 family endonuclease
MKVHDTLPVMGISTPARPITVEEYLSNPEYQHCEYVNGEVVPLNVGTKSHSTIQFNCALALRPYLLAHPGGWGATELHCRLNIRGRIRYRLPDVAIILRPKTDDPYLDGAPDLAIEIRSPEDSFIFLVDKSADYFANGAKLVWLILPEEQSVIVLGPNGPPHTVKSGETLTAPDLLPGLEIPVSELFA